MSFLHKLITKFNYMYIVEMANKLVPWVLPESVPVLTGNPRIDWVWVWVWGIPDFFSWVWGWAWGCTYTRHNTRPRHIFILV